MSKLSQNSHYVITYRDPKDGKVVECKARSISDSNLGLSFISISEFVFNKSSMVVDPNEEYLQKRFEKVKSLHLSIYSIISVEEVGSENMGLKFDKDKSNLVMLNPNNNSTPPQSPN